jgi:putative FmdB family regulatory protein
VPLYEYKCRWCGGEETGFRKVDLRHDFECSKCGNWSDLQVSAPAIHSEIQPYESPTTGKMIESRAQRREDLKASGCVEWDRGMKEEVQRRVLEREALLEREVERTIDSTIAALPARKREALEGEMAGGLDASIERGTL